MPSVPMHCTHCQSRNLAPGFLGAMTQHHRHVSWVAGPMERGVLGGTKMFGRTRLLAEAFRCGDCGHLELFAVQSDN